MEGFWCAGPHPNPLPGGEGTRRRLRGDGDVVGEGGFDLGLGERFVVDGDSGEGDVVDGVVGVVAFEF